MSISACKKLEDSPYCLFKRAHENWCRSEISCLLVIIILRNSCTSVTEVFRLVDYSNCEINRACAIAIDSAQLLQSINSRNSKTKMPIPYSLDLRWRVIWLHLAHHLNCKDISHQVSLSESTVYRYINAFEQTGDVAPRVSTHGPQKLLGDFEQLVLLRIILENTGIYLHEIQAKLVTMFGVTVSVATIC